MKKAKRIISLITAALLALALTACSALTGESSSTTGTTAAKSSEVSTATSQPASDDIMTPYGKYPEPITISVAKVASADPRIPEGETITDNAFTKLIFDKLNIKVEVAWEVDQSEYINKLSLNIAANDLPDAFNLDATTQYLTYKQLVQNDLLADLSEGYAKCAGQYMKDTFGSFKEMNLEPFRENGKLYGIAGGFYGYEHNLLWVRKDWLKECNLPEPKTLDDVKNIIKTFKDKNMGGKGNVGLVLDPQYPASSNYYAATPIFGALHAYPKTWIKDASGKVVWGSVAPEMKAALKVLADWYKEGLIDKQFPTRTAPGAVDALIKDSQTGIFFAPWWEVYVLFPDFPKNNPDAELWTYNAPLDENGKYNILWPGPANTVMCVDKKFAHPEAIVKMLNVEWDAWRGIDAEGGKIIQKYIDAGTDWVYFFPTGGVNLEFADIIPNSGYLTKNYIDNGKMEGKGFVTEFNRNAAKAAKSWIDTKSLDNNGWLQYYGSYVASNIVAAPEVQIQYPAFSFSTDSMADLKANLDKLEDETMLQIIMGEKPVDYFDTFVKEWYAQGGDIITKEVQSMVK